MSRKRNTSSSSPEPLDERPALEERAARAELQIDRALALVEQAQRLLGEAQQALCRVQGMVPEWKALGCLYDCVTRTWFRIRAKANRLRRRGGLLLDSSTVSRRSDP